MDSDSADRQCTYVSSGIPRSVADLFKFTPLTELLELLQCLQPHPNRLIVQQRLQSLKVEKQRSEWLLKIAALVALQKP